MKKSFIVLLFLTGVAIGFMGCSKDTTETCNLNASNVTTEDITITFTATSTGDGVISSLTYSTNVKTETVTNPTLPWTMQADATGSGDVSIVATGTVTDGSLTIELSGESATGKVVSDDFCSHSN